jgi:hypothetical protein
MESFQESGHLHIHQNVVQTYLLHFFRALEFPTCIYVFFFVHVSFEIYLRQISMKTLKKTSARVKFKKRVIFLFCSLFQQIFSGYCVCYYIILSK